VAILEDEAIFADFARSSGSLEAEQLLVQQVVKRRKEWERIIPMTII
jgi:hypothetical protein